MKNKLLLATTALSLLGLTTKAQVSSYSFIQTTGSYGAPNTGSLVGAILQDDDVTNVNLPFAFVYNGTTYNNINLCSNGFLSFGALNGDEYNAISDATTKNVLAPFAQDLLMGTVIVADITAGSNTLTNCSSVNGFSVGDVIMDLGNDFGGINPTVTAVSGGNIVLNTTAIGSIQFMDIFNMNGRIRQSVSGTAPNRVCEFEFANATRYFEYDEVLHFKVRLYETSNKIEFVYGGILPGFDDNESEVGLKGNSNADFNSRHVMAPNAWLTSVAATSISDACEFSGSSFPVNGLSYIWTPAACSTPTLTVTQSHSLSCTGRDAILTASGATTYSWSTGATTAQMTVTPSANTTYTITGFNGNCASSTTVTQNVISAPVMSIAQSKTLSCPGEPVTLTASGATTYSWANGPATALYAVTLNTTTTFTVTGDNGACTSQSIIVQDVALSCTGINGVAANTVDVTVYPNPFNSTLTVKSGNSKKISVTITDALGKTVYSADNDKTIDTGFLNTGIYFVTISTEDGKATRKIIKE